MTLTLPYPPSTNHNAYWGQVGHRRYLTKAAKEFRSRVLYALAKAWPDSILRSRVLFDAPVALTVDLYPADRRKRDIDNPIKALLDALQHAGAIADDSLVQTITVTRREVVKGGKCVVTIGAL